MSPFFPKVLKKLTFENISSTLGIPKAKSVAPQQDLETLRVNSPHLKAAILAVFFLV